MNLLRMNPSRELEEMSERFARLIGRLPGRRENGKEVMAVADWAPAVDISEDDKEYVIKAELSEVNKEDVKVMVQDGVLTIQGERKQEKEDKGKGKKYHRIERTYGTFVRSFIVPDDADETKVVAEFKEGVLKVHLPKPEKAKPRAIEVKVAA